MAGWSRHPHPPYADRVAAGTDLAGRLTAYAGRPDVVVLGLPRGGVPVAAVVAERLGAALDVLVVRKLGLPRRPEVAMGAIAGAGAGVETVRNTAVIRRAGVADMEFAAVHDAETAELRRREQAYRGSRRPVAVAGRSVVLVDDGLATGATMRVAARVIQRQGPARLVLAAPVGPPEVCAALASEADELCCPWQPRDFTAVGAAYIAFDQTSNEEVRRLLAGATDRGPAGGVR